MKSLFYFLLIAILLFSCDDKHEIETPPTQEVNKYKTGKDLSTTFAVTYERSGTELEFNALGFGYDITGKYAHPSWIRQQIVDVKRIKNDYFYKVVKDGYFVAGSTNVYTGAREKVRSQMLENIGIPETEAEKFKNALSAMFDHSFKHDKTFPDETYYYAYTAWIGGWNRYYIYLQSPNDLIPYLTERFIADLENLPASGIIKKYGTHILVSFYTGFRNDFLFRATTDQDLEKRLVKAGIKYLSDTPGILTSDPPEYNLDKENIYYELVAGQPPYPNAYMIDITNYDDDNGLKPNIIREEATEENIALINFGNSTLNQLIPIYEVIEDAQIKEEVKKEYTKYLCE